MREKLQRLWDSSGRWFLLGLPLAAVILGIVIWQANQAVQPPRETIADPPTETSDLDFLVDTTGTELKSLLTLGALYTELEEAFQKPIDLITLNSLTQRAQMPSEEAFRDTVWKERVNLYEVA